MLFSGSFSPLFNMSYLTIEMAIEVITNASVNIPGIEALIMLYVIHIGDGKNDSIRIVRGLLTHTDTEPIIIPTVGKTDMGPSHVSTPAAVLMPTNSHSQNTLPKNFFSRL
jgi:hypothetical protein